MLLSLVYQPCTFVRVTGRLLSMCRFFGSFNVKTRILSCILPLSWQRWKTGGINSMKVSLKIIIIAMIIVDNLKKLIQQFKMFKILNTV